MLLIREIMYCKPGKVRPMVEKFLAMSKLSAKAGMPKMRVMTDLLRRAVLDTRCRDGSRQRGRV